jgi:hypothetical protein
VVLFHHVGKDITVFIQSIAFYSFKKRERLKAEFGKVTKVVIPIIGEGLVPVPHFQVMDVAPVRIVGKVKTASRRGTCGPVEGCRIVLPENLGEMYSYILM